MPLRVGDSFVADVNDFAVAASYAVDIGASVIQEALGTLDNSALARWAIDYAYDNHVTVIASAADENSFHHNFPGTNNHTVYVHAIRYNADRRGMPVMHSRSTTAQTTARSCSCRCRHALLIRSDGSGFGMAGLLYGAALQADLPAPGRLHPPGKDDAPRASWQIRAIVAATDGRRSAADHDRHRRQVL